MKQISGPASQIENGFARVQILRGIPTAVVLLDDLGRNGVEIAWIVINRATEGGFGGLRGGGVSFLDRCLGIHWRRRRATADFYHELGGSKPSFISTICIARKGRVPSTP